jgi:hypothetical protein
MKIQKFNESVKRTWAKNKIKKMFDEDYDLGILILIYLELNHLELFEDKKEYYHLNEYWFEEDEDNLFNIYYTHGGYKRKETINYTFSNKEFKDLLSYMNNPDMYEKLKKFNI